MRGVTLEQVQSDLAEFRAARTKILQAQAYAIHGRSFTRADLQEINAEIHRLEGMESSLQNGRSGGIRIRQVVNRYD